MTNLEEITKYAKSCIGGEIPSGQKHKWACERFLNDLKRIGDPDFPYIWDEERADKIVRWFSLLHHSKGKLSGQPIRLTSWQKFRECQLYGWRHTDTGFKRFKKAFTEVGRKNAKSQMEAGEALNEISEQATRNQETYEVKMVSVYRDTFMRLKDGSYNKANAAYSYFGPDGGVALLNENMDMNIEKYVSVNFNALVDVIDAVGGMDLELTDAEVVHMNNYCVETSEVTGKSYKKIEPEVGGSYHLNGVQAVSYARIRYTDGGDAQRTVRQRIVLLNIMQKLQQMDLTTINKIADSVFPQIATNFSFTEILNYAKDFQKYRVGETLGFPNTRYSKMLSGVGSTEIADTLASNVAEVHQFLFGDTDYQVSGTVKGIDDEIKDALSSGKYEETDETEKENEKSEDKTSEETNHTESDIEVTEDGNAGTDSGNSSADSGSGSSAVTEPQQPDTETPPDYYEEDYYYGDD